MLGLWLVLLPRYRDRPDRGHYPPHGRPNCHRSFLRDEIGYLTVGAGAGNLFFQLVNARYEGGAIILTSNRGFGGWR
jgi:IstB-like ATP binding protein